MTPDEAVEKFKIERPKYEGLALTLADELRRLLARWGVAFDHVASRVKGIEEFRDKIVRKKYDEPFRQCEDLCGLRVVALYHTDVDRIVDNLASDAKDAFPEQRVEDKRPALQKDQPFGYSSVHVIVRSVEAPDIPVEIQVRTIMQHGWAQVEHKLRYALERSKGGPKSSPLAREFQKLAALLELADDSFLRLRDAGSTPHRQQASTVEAKVPKRANSQTKVSPTVKKRRTRPEPTWLAEAPGSNQRDVAWRSGRLIWSQERPGDLRLRLKDVGGEVDWLSPEGFKEYMGRMDDRYVVAYRQPGGVVLYDLESKTAPEMLTQGGIPSGLGNGLIVVQGDGFTDGIGSGISLYRTDKTLVKRLSEKGYSASFEGASVVWQEHPDLYISHPPYESPPELLANNASHASMHNALVTWVVSGRSPIVRGMDLVTNDRYQIDRPGTFQHVQDFRVAYLSPTEGKNYDLVVRDLLLEKDILHIPAVGFPTGRGPQLTPGQVIWEALHPGGHMNLRSISLPPATWMHVVNAVKVAYAPCQDMMNELAAGFESTPLHSAHIQGIVQIHLDCLEKAMVAISKKRVSGCRIKNQGRWRVLRRLAAERQSVLWQNLTRFPNIPMPERDWAHGVALIGARILEPEQ